MGVEAIDLYYIHRRDPSLPLEEVTETLVGFIKSEKIKQFGFSEISPTSLARVNAIHPVGTVQSEYSLSTRAPELGLIQKTSALGTSLIAFCPMGRSLLTNRPHSSEQAETMPFLVNNPRFFEPNLSNNVKATNGFRALASQMGVKASSLAIAWLLHQGDHVLPILGTRSVEHLKELAAVTEIKLSSSDLDEIERQLPIGWAHGDRYSDAQWTGPEKFF